MLLEDSHTVFDLFPKAALVRTIILFMAIDICKRYRHVRILNLKKISPTPSLAETIPLHSKATLLLAMA